MAHLVFCKKSLSLFTLALHSQPLSSSHSSSATRTIQTGSCHLPVENPSLISHQCNKRMAARALHMCCSHSPVNFCMTPACILDLLWMPPYQRASRLHEMRIIPRHCLSPTLSYLSSWPLSLLDILYIQLDCSFIDFPPTSIRLQIHRGRIVCFICCFIPSTVSWYMIDAWQNLSNDLVNG